MVAVAAEVVAPVVVDASYEAAKPSSTPPSSRERVDACVDGASYIGGVVVKGVIDRVVVQGVIDRVVVQGVIDGVVVQGVRERIRVITFGWFGASIIIF